MEPISNADRLVVLLRRKLEERAKTASARSGGKRDRATAPDTAAGVRALAALDGADERAARRAVVQHLLADELGPDLLNDAQFQQVVSRVTEAIEQDDGGADLLSEVLERLRA